LSNLTPGARPTQFLPFEFYSKLAKNTTQIDEKRHVYLNVLKIRNLIESSSFSTSRNRYFTNEGNLNGHTIYITRNPFHNVDVEKDV